jgi:hypothetical protein
MDHLLLLRKLQVTLSVVFPSTVEPLTANSTLSFLPDVVWCFLEVTLGGQIIARYETTVDSGREAIQVEL